MCQSHWTTPSTHTHPQRVPDIPKVIYSTANRYDNWYSTHFGTDYRLCMLEMCRLKVVKLQHTRGIAVTKTTTLSSIHSLCLLYNVCIHPVKTYHDRLSIKQITVQFCIEKGRFIQGLKTLELFTDSQWWQININNNLNNSIVYCHTTNIRSWL